MQFRPKMFVAKTKAKLLPRSRPPAGPVRLTGWARWKMRCNVRGRSTVRAKKLNAWTPCEMPRNY